MRFSDFLLDGRPASTGAPVAGNFGEKARCSMKTGQRQWTCRHCGRPDETAADAVGGMTCASCAGVSGATSESPLEAPPDADARKRGIVARLRERYGEAREFILTEPPPEDRAHLHLEWILGGQNGPVPAGASLDTEVSELVVLWLEDLARELDDQASFPGADRGAAKPKGVRRAAAEGLRSATREFAEEFLNAPPVPAPEP
jgi:hypothetical protein